MNSRYSPIIVVAYPSAAIAPSALYSVAAADNEQRNSDVIAAL